MAKRAMRRRYPLDKEPTCHYSEYRGISFRVPTSVLKRLPTGTRAALSGRVVKGKFVIDQGARRNVFLPQNICWWEEVRKAKQAGARASTRRGSKRRSARRSK